MSGYYLVKGVLEISPYMGKEEREDVTRLVIADSESEAEVKFRNYFESKSVEYSVSYWVFGVEVLETIK